MVHSPTLQPQLAAQAQFMTSGQTHLPMQVGPCELGAVPPTYMGPGMMMTQADTVPAMYYPQDPSQPVPAALYPGQYSVPHGVQPNSYFPGQPTMTPAASQVTMIDPYHPGYFTVSHPPHSPFSQSPHVQGPHLHSPHLSSPHRHSPYLHSPLVHSPHTQSPLLQSTYLYSPHALVRMPSPHAGYLHLSPGPIYSLPNQAYAPPHQSQASPYYMPNISPRHSAQPTPPVVVPFAGQPLVHSLTPPTSGAVPPQYWPHSPTLHTHVPTPQFHHNNLTPPSQHKAFPNQAQPSPGTTLAPAPLVRALSTNRQGMQVW